MCDSDNISRKSWWATCRLVSVKSECSVGKQNRDKKTTRGWKGGRDGMGNRGVEFKRVGENKQVMTEMYGWDGEVIWGACLCLYVGVWGKWEGREACFLGLEKQPSWQCVGGESPEPGPPARGLSLALRWSGLLSLTGCGPGLYTEVLTWCFLFGKF